MRIIVFFDLPTETRENMRDYNRFRKGLLKNGFFMMQESVYCKLVLNQSNAINLIDTVRRIKPANGLVQLLSVTEKQFQKMEFIVGESSNDTIDSDERILII